jgi:hypothetical protein
MREYRTWHEWLHDLNCPECWPKVVYRRAMRELVVLGYPEPTEAEIDAMLEIPPDWPEGAS